MKNRSIPSLALAALALALPCAAHAGSFGTHPSVIPTPASLDASLPQHMYGHPASPRNGSATAPDIAVAHLSGRQSAVFNPSRVDASLPQHTYGHPASPRIAAHAPVDLATSDASAQK